MKTAVFILLALSFMTCKSIQFDQTPPFQIIEATYNTWIGGQPGVSGINVFINYTSTTTVAFDSIYFRNQGVRLESVSKNGKNSIAGYFSTSSGNSTLDFILHKESKKEAGNSLPEKKIPFVLKEHEAVISYKDGSNTKYYKITELKKSKTNFYQ